MTFRQTPPNERQSLQAQLYRYAEDMNALLGDYDLLLQRFQGLEIAQRAAADGEGLLATAMRTVCEAYVATDDANRILYQTRGASLLAGPVPGIGGNVLSLFNPAGHAAIEAYLGRRAASPKEAGAPLDVEFRRANGAFVPGSLQVFFQADTGEQERRHWILQPDSRPAVDRQPSGSERAGEAALFLADGEGQIISVNPAFTRITGYTAEEVVGQSIRSLKSHIQPQHLQASLWSRLQATGTWQGEVRNRSKNGTPYAEWLIINAAYGEGGELAGYLGVFHNLGSLREAARQLAAGPLHHDALTGLPNRQLFADRMHMALGNARRDQHRMALLHVNLDRFKQINDSFGHATGDALLKEASARIRHQTRDVDTVARLDGDEFVVILPHLREADDANTVAAKLVESFRQPVAIDGHELYVSPSIGIAVYPEHGDSAPLLLRRADLAMYQAKTEGGNAFHVFEKLDETAVHGLDVESALRGALSRNELHLVYQPQVCVSGKRLLGVEALLRWHSPTLGEISPDIFIAIAERTGLILDIGHWVLRTACQQLARWRDDGLDGLRLAINIAPRQLRHERFASQVFAALAEFDLPGRMLELEITESQLMLYPASTIAKLNALRSHGITIAIDDFGTGYSSLARLRSLPVDRLKVDRSFIRDLDGNDEALAISACIVGLARVMNLEVIAEGVETERQRGHLLAQGCHAIQGFFFARPMRPEALPAWNEQTFARSPSENTCSLVKGNRS